MLACLLTTARGALSSVRVIDSYGAQRSIGASHTRQDDWTHTCPPSARLEGTSFVKLRYGRTAFCLREASANGQLENGKDARPVVVLLHGMNGWSFVWAKLMDALLESGRCKAVLAFDRYGRGLSDVATDPKTGQAVDHSAALFSDQLRELLEAVEMRDGGAVVSEKLVVAASSMGGLIATQFAATHADLVSRLVLLAPAGLTPWTTMDRAVLTTSGIGPLYHFLYGRQKEVRAIAEGKFSSDVPSLDSSDPTLLQTLTSAALWQVEQKPGYLWDVYRDITQMQWDGQYCNAYKIGQRGTDVQLVWGLYDSVMYVYYAQFWKQAIPHATLTTLETSCHCPHLVQGYLPKLVDVILPSAAK